MMPPAFGRMGDNSAHGYRRHLAAGDCPAGRRAGFQHRPLPRGKGWVQPAAPGRPGYLNRPGHEAAIMLNIGFGEMIVIAGACLIVIGPKRLPSTARFVGHLYARVTRQVASVRSEIKKEMDLEDMRRDLRETEQAVRQAGREISEPIGQLAEQARLAPEDAAPEPEQGAGRPQRS